MARSVILPRPGCLDKLISYTAMVRDAAVSSIVREEIQDDQLLVGGTSLRIL